MATVLRVTTMEMRVAKAVACVLAFIAKEAISPAKAVISHAHVFIAKAVISHAKAATSHVPVTIAKAVISLVRAVISPAKVATSSVKAATSHVPATIATAKAMLHEEAKAASVSARQTTILMLSTA